MQKILPNKTYRHYKGNLYKVLAIGKNSETLEDMVIYQSIKTNEIWIRPIYMWNETIDKNGTLRFTLVE